MSVFFCRAWVPAVLCFFHLSGALAQTDNVVISASREPLQARVVAADVVVIDAERIRNSPADSLEDLLRREAGLQVSRNGGPGANAGVFIRGASSGQTLLLIDGMRVGSATLGAPEFQALSLASIDRIEVLRGPGSSLYGADALGGVVQIFSKRGTGAPQAALNAAVGGYGAREAGLSVHGAQGGFDLSTSLAHERLRGVSALLPGDQFGNHNPDTDGFTRTSGSAQVGYTLAPGQRVALQASRSRLNAQYDASEFEPPSFAQNPAPDFRNKGETSAASLSHAGRWSAAFSSQARLSQSDSDLQSGGSTVDRFRTRRSEAAAQASWAPQPGQQFTLGLETLTEKAQSSSYARDAERRNHAAVLAYAGAVGALQVQADVRRDDNSVYGAVNTARLGGSLALADGWRLRALAGSTFRAPSFNDLVFPGYGVPSIQPERGRSSEVGVDWRDALSHAGLTVFKNRVRDLIAYESNRSFCPADAAFNFGCARNLNSATLQGATLSGASRVGAFDVRATLDFLSALDNTTGQRLARRAAKQFSLAADHSSGPWRLGAALLHVGARPDSGVVLPASTTLDLSSSWRLSKQVMLTGKLLNATDRNVQPARDYQALGRQAWLGLRLSGVGL